MAAVPEGSPDGSREFTCYKDTGHDQAAALLGAMRSTKSAGR